MHCRGALREEYLGAIRDAGFGEVEVLSDITYKTKQVRGDPITSDVAAVLAGAAASITVLARKGW